MIELCNETNDGKSALKGEMRSSTKKNEKEKQVEGSSRALTLRSHTFYYRLRGAESGADFDF